MMHRLMVCLTALSFLTCPVFSVWQVCAAQDKNLAGSQEKLAEIEREIEAGSRDLQQKRAKAGSLAEDLARLDGEVGQLASDAKRSRQELAKLDEQIEQARQEQAVLQESLQSAGRRVRKRLAVLYKSGEIGLARVLLGSTVAPYEMAENHAFLARIVRHDRQLIEEYRNKAEQLENRLVQVEQLRARQARLTEKSKQQHAALTQARQTKRKLLAQIRKDEELLAGYLDELRAKAARLGELVKKLEAGPARAYTDTSSPFIEQRGRLAWPVAGEIRVGFGTSQNAELGTLLESNGLEIAAEAGSEVKAVWSGKVLYASLLRGYGKLMIIDHGDKYYSLYAQVADFAKQAGEQVTAGETIASSGFEGRDFLYFEIRRSGKPVDPLSWLQRQ